MKAAKVVEFLQSLDHMYSNLASAANGHESLTNGMKEAIQAAIEQLLDYNRPLFQLSNLIYFGCIATACLIVKNLL